MSRSASLFIGCLLACGVAAPVHGQSDEASRGAGIPSGRSTVQPVRAATAPVIDGQLDDPVWVEAAHISEFVQLAPRAGQPATEATDAYIAYDSDNLYLGFRARYSDTGLLRANRKDRDVQSGDDMFWVYLDPFLDQQRAYAFGINAYGVQSDTILSTRVAPRTTNRKEEFGGQNDSGGSLRLPFGDASWDALFASAGRIAADGFTVEMAIPFKSLRYPQRTGAAVHQWGLQIARRIRGKNETVVWSPVSRSVAGFLTQMGLLQGMTGLSTSRNLEIQPTFTAVQFRRLDSDGHFVSQDLRPEGGVNFKYGVTSNLTADVTFNPDFSQIESDQPQIDVNQRFALFYPELRPFFLEGAEIFDVRGPATIVHTRTIVDPRYGVKLTGKAGKTAVGVMYANDEAPGNVDHAPEGIAGRAAQTFVGRVRYDLYSESFVGATFTNREFLDSYSRVGALDSLFRLGDTHQIGLRAFGSQHRDLDGRETSGHVLSGSIRKTGRNLGYLLAGSSLSPDFKTDVGFVRQAGQRRLFGEVSYRWWPEGRVVSWGPRFRYERFHEFGGVLEHERSIAAVDVAFADNIDLSGEVSRGMERFGGIDYPRTRYQFFGVVSKLRAFSFGIGGNSGDQILYDPEHPFLGRDRGWNAFLNLRFLSKLESRLSADTNRFVDVHGNDALVFDVNIVRLHTTYQFTDRLRVRNINELNSFDERFSLNVLFTYRVNAGTAFHVGYDDRYQHDHTVVEFEGNDPDDRFFQSAALTRTNRAFFVKLQYLFRY